MRKILIIGSGKSTPYLVKYLLDKSQEENIQVTVGDININDANKLIGSHKNGNAIKLDVFDKNSRKSAIQNADIIVSMLPTNFHIEVAKDCIIYGKNMVTASYISDAMQALDQEVKNKGLIFMNEIGLDPGIDHMSAMQVIDRIRDKGGKMILFESSTGGLVAPESDTNSWNYKFTWNPRNVIVAGQGGAAKFLKDNTSKYISYNQLFQRTELLNIDDFGQFEIYANRDSLKYQSVYGLDDINTLYRGTIRRVGFSRAWNLFVVLGMTDDSYVIGHSEKMSYRDFVDSFLPYSSEDSVELKFRQLLNIDKDDVIWGKLMELDFFSKTKMVELKKATPAQILQKILMDCWTLGKNDKDMIVMYHKFGYELNGEKYQIDSSMITIGEDQIYTAMAKTVGFPVAIATLAILNKKITTLGVQIPVAKEVYTPILNELVNNGIIFKEREEKKLFCV